jgi:hypothetical protein
MNYKCELICDVRLSNGDYCTIYNEEVQLPFPPVKQMTLSWSGDDDAYGWSWAFEIYNAEWIITESRFQLRCKTDLVEDGEDDEESLREAIACLFPLGFKIISSSTGSPATFPAAQ